MSDKLQFVAALQWLYFQRQRQTEVCRTFKKQSSSPLKLIL